MPQRKTYRRRAAAGGKNKKMKAVARREAKKVLRAAIESKQYDGSSNTTPSYSGRVDYATFDTDGSTSMVQGTANGAYVGSLIKPTYLMIRGQLVASDTTNMVRFIVVQRKGGGGAPAASEILESVSNTRTPLSPLEKDFDRTYTVLADRLWALNTGVPSRTVKVKISGRKMRQIAFSDGSGTIEANGIYMYTFTDSSTGNPTVQLLWRLHYTDA